jgi:hypothetical protein
MKNRGALLPIFKSKLKPELVELGLRSSDIT